MRAVIVTGRYKSLHLGQVLEVERLDRTSVKFRDIEKIYVPSVCVCVDEEGNRMTQTNAIALLRKERGSSK